MKKFLKSVSLIIVAMMLLASIPFSANAKSLMTTTTTNYNDNAPLLSLDTLLLDEETTVNGITVSATEYDNCVVGTDIDTIYGTGTKGWVHAGVTTSLDLNATTKYTIEFYMKRSDYHYAGFLWTVVNEDAAWTGSAGLIGDYYENKNIHGADGERNNSRGTYGATSEFWANYAEADGYTKFVVELDGYKNTVYIDGNKVGSITDTSYATDNLGLGFIGFTNVAPYTEAIMSIKNVKVYSGLYSNTEAVLDCEVGDVLLTVDNLLDATTAKSDFDDVTVTDKGFQDCQAGEQTDAIYGTGTKGWVYAGLNTSLVLTADSKYTIDFYMQRYDYHYSGFVWTTNSWATAQGMVGNYYENKQICTVKGGTSNPYGNYGSTTDFWATYAVTDQNSDNFGYTHFIIQIDGYKSTVYVAGNKVGEVDMAKDGYTSNTIGLGMVAFTNVAPYTGAIMSIKDVTVRYGNVTESDNIKFVKRNGADFESIGAVTKNYGDVLTEAELPEVETADGNIVKWFYKDTNVMVTFPYTVTYPITIEAREINTYAINVAGMQYTDPAKETQSVRFISAIHTLQAEEVGFEITAVYKDANGNILNDKEWSKKSTVVYTSIKAEVDGTVKSVTANQLGGTYLIALAVDDVPTGLAQVDFYVTSYIKIDDTKTVRSTTQAYTLVNGEYSATATPLQVNS